mmetsp:Transcript_6772/g.8833  ORF Transcript_6772/g.8833 Transcript_6772/m.8833 type:complete len:90 (-) Transcript_6772:3-272(-)
MEDKANDDGEEVVLYENPVENPHTSTADDRKQIIRAVIDERSFGIFWIGCNRYDIFYDNLIISSNAQGALVLCVWVALFQNIVYTCSCI